MPSARKYVQTVREITIITKYKQTKKQIAPTPSDNTKGVQGNEGGWSLHYDLIGFWTIVGKWE